MAAKSESFGQRVGTERRVWKPRKGARRVFSSIRDWSAGMHVGPSPSAQVGRHTGARI